MYWFFSDFIRMHILLHFMITFSFIYSTIVYLAKTTWELTHWNRPWCWEGLGAGGEGDNRGWDGWMASPTWWTWVWVNSGSWWWTGRPGVLQSMGLQWVGHNWVTELNWMWELDCEEHWAPKNWCFWIVVLEKTVESPLDSKEIKPVHPEGDQSWVSIGRTYAEAETPVLWPPDGKSWLIWKDPDAGRDWGQEEKGTTEDEMAGWHHWLDGHGFE